MELRHLTTFIHVCEFMSFSKAAEHLGYTQSSVTQQIQQLEAELGVELFAFPQKGWSFCPMPTASLPLRLKQRQSFPMPKSQAVFFALGRLNPPATIFCRLF